MPNVKYQVAKENKLPQHQGSVNRSLAAAYGINPSNNGNNDFISNESMRNSKYPNDSKLPIIQESSINPGIEKISTFKMKK